MPDARCSSFRRNKGCPGESRKYEVGIFALYESTGLPVVPIAPNSGHLWGRNSWTKRAGRSRSSSCPPSPPGWRAATSWPALKPPSRPEWRFSTPWSHRRGTGGGRRSWTDHRGAGRAEECLAAAAGLFRGPADRFFPRRLLQHRPAGPGAVYRLRGDDRRISRLQQVGRQRLSTLMPQFGFPGLKMATSGACAPPLGAGP